MQEIAGKVVAKKIAATCYHDEIHKVISRYKNQIPLSQILSITNSVLREELEINLNLKPEEHLKHAIHGHGFKYVCEDTLELPNVPAWIAEQMTESERAAFAKWYNKIQNEIEANKLGDTLQSDKPFIHHCSSQEIAEADCDGDIRHCKDACHKRS